MQLLLIFQTLQRLNLLLQLSVEKQAILLAVFWDNRAGDSQLAPYASLNPQEQEIRDLMTAYESLDGQALAGQDQSISPFQVGGAMPYLREQNKPVREMQKAMPARSNEEIVSAMNAPADPGGVLMELQHQVENPLL